MTPPTTAEVLQRIAYEPETGCFQWVSHPIKRYIGTKAGSANNQGYISIKIADKQYKAHRLAILIMTGEWPQEDVDHINRDKSDNRYCNLRVASRSQNISNSPARSNNVSGYKGVYFSNATRVKNKKWRATIGYGKNRKSLGYYETAELAAVAYDRAAKERYGEFANSSPMLRAIAESK